MSGIDYSFTKNGAVESEVNEQVVSNFMGLPQKKDPVEVMRRVMNQWDDKLAEIKQKAEDFKIDSDEKLQEATELIGQAKTLSQTLTEKAEEHYKPFYNRYKDMRNILTALTPIIDQAISNLQLKSDDFVNLREIKRREEEQEAARKAAELQAEIDKKQKQQQAAEEKAAKKEGREPVVLTPVIVNKPIIPATVKAKTEHGTMTTKPELQHEITDLESDFIKQLILTHCKPAYKTLADTAIKKAIKAGVLGVKGCPGVKVEEKYVAKHRRR